MQIKGKLYALILGRKPVISIAEILSFIPEKQIVEIKGKTLFFSQSKAIKDPQDFLDQLGGSLKLIEVFEGFRRPKDDQKLLDQLPKWIPFLTKYFQKRFKKRQTKFHYGASLFNFPQKREIFLKNLLKESKKDLKNAGLRARFINNKAKNLNSAAIIKEGLLKEKGVEINLIMTDKVLYFAETLAVQNIDRYSLRDYHKPFRDAKSGMLPPKLAQVMINVANPASARKSKINLIYDPFCGSGTVLMESLIKDYHVAGSDLSKDATTGARQNLAWLKKTLNLNPKTKVKVFTKDALKLNLKDLRSLQGGNRMPSLAIVTEPYLGPPLLHLPDTDKRKLILIPLYKLYLSFFKNLASMLPAKTPIVISFPAFKNRNQFHLMENIVEKVKELGYSVVDLIPEKIIKDKQLTLSDRGTYLYDRPDQIIVREIVKFIKK